MDDALGIVIAIGLALALVVALFMLVIPEPGQRAVIATERLDVAVLAFENSSSWPGVGETLRARIETELVNASGITVFSRSRLDELLTEQMLGEVGLIDPATAARIGSLTGVSKLLTGTVYGIESRSEETTVCEEWKDGECVQSVPAIRYTVRVLGQIQVVSAQTGQIEQALDVERGESITVKQGNTFGGYETLIAQAADDIASDMASLLTFTYTRELRYGLYRSVKPKRNGYVGEDETTRFERSDGEAYLIVHFTRIRSDNSFDLSWIDPEGNVVKSVDDIVSSRDWRLYQLDLSDLPDGRFTVSGALNGIEAFEKAFILNP